jgi:hypothetical protein
VVDEAEWKSSFNALARVGNYSISNYINYLLAKPTNAEAEQKQRIALILNWQVKVSSVYRDPLRYENAFVEMMEGLKAINRYVNMCMKRIQRS